MKKGTKSVIAAILTGAMIMSIAGCANFELITHKQFKKALEDAAKIDEDEIRETKDDKYEGADVKRRIVATDGKCVYSYIEFDDAEDAYDTFSEIYDDFTDAVEDDEFDGSYRKGINENSGTGYILVNGDSDNEDFIDGKCYGGIFLKENTFVVVLANSQKSKDMDKIDAVLDAIGYPKP